MSGATAIWRRFAAILALGVLALISGAPGAQAETTSETGVTVVLADSGTLDIHFGDQPVHFLSDGEDPAPTAVDGAVATGTLTLVVHDTRAADARHGYTVAISSTGLQTDDGGWLLDASHLAILAVQGLPDSAGPASFVGATLDQPVTILTVQKSDAALDATLAISLQLTIPSGAISGAYGGGIVLSVTPLADAGV